MQLDKRNQPIWRFNIKQQLDKRRSCEETEKIVASILNDFNKDLIKIYLTSIIDNLHNAQKMLAQL